MKKVQNYLILFPAVVVFQSQITMAQSNANLSEYFRQRIQQVQKAAESEVAASGGKGMQIENINIDLIPSVGFGIHEVLNVTISPEIDFVLVPEEPEEVEPEVKK